MYKPSWKDFVNLTKKFVSKHLWRMEALGYEYNDLMQECFIKFMECSKHNFDSRESFCTYYTRALENMFHTMANFNNIKSKNEQRFDEDINYKFEKQKGVFHFRFDNVKDFTGKLDKAPSEVRKVIEYLTSIPLDEFHKYFKVRCGVTSKRLKSVFCNRFLCHALGYKSREKNIYDMTLKFLQENSN